LLIERLEREAKQLSCARFETIYHRAELYDKANKRSTVGKHHTIISKDFEHFESLFSKPRQFAKKAIMWLKTDNAT